MASSTLFSQNVAILGLFSSKKILWTVHSPFFFHKWQKVATKIIRADQQRNRRENSCELLEVPIVRVGK